MKLPDAPQGWAAEDEDLTAFIDYARRNAFATYSNLHLEYGKVSTVDRIFRDMNDNLTNTKDWFAALFLLQSHSAFRAASQLAMSGQTAEVYAVLRLCLENGLYGFYLAKNPASHEIWLRRHDSEECKKRVRNEFTIRRLLDAVEECDKSEATIAEQLYEACIDYGAHPNERALIQRLEKQTTESNVQFQIIYLTDDADIFRISLRAAARVGASVLGIFRLVFKERFDISGLTQKLDEVRKGL